MRNAICLAALVLAGPALAEPFHHAYGEWREYNRDWLAACPDIIDEDGPDFYAYSCFASTGSAELNGASLPAYKLTLIRNRLDGTLDVAITVAPTTGAYDADRAMELHFGGAAPLALRLGESLETRFNTTNQFFVLEPQRTGLIEKMQERTAVTLAVPLEGRPRPVESRLSLQGVMASLDFMETYARRVAQY